jgi:hypothetical protein
MRRGREGFPLRCLSDLRAKIVYTVQDSKMCGHTEAS